jgi:PKD repeat protein
MTINLRIVRKTVIGVFLLMALTVELAIFTTAASAQNYGTGMASAPYSGVTANAMSSGTYGMAALPITTSNPSHAAPNASLLAVPVVGTAPLTVDFHVGLANPQSSLVYQWHFGDGAVSSLPAGAYIPHVYQRPGTYLCFLTLTNVQGRSTTLLTTVTVVPPKG